MRELGRLTRRQEGNIKMYLGQTALCPTSGAANVPLSKTLSNESPHVQRP